MHASDVARPGDVRSELVQLAADGHPRSVRTGVREGEIAPFPAPPPEE